jgi:hypothetical protein
LLHISVDSEIDIDDAARQVAALLAIAVPLGVVIESYKGRVVVSDGGGFWRSSMEFGSIVGADITPLSHKDPAKRLVAALLNVLNEVQQFVHDGPDSRWPLQTMHSDEPIEPMAWIDGPTVRWGYGDTEARAFAVEFQPFSRPDGRQ